MLGTEGESKSGQAAFLIVPLASKTGASSSKVSRLASRGTLPGAVQSFALATTHEPGEMLQLQGKVKIASAIAIQISLSIPLILRAGLMVVHRSR